MRAFICSSPQIPSLISSIFHDGFILNTTIILLQAWVQCIISSFTSVTTCMNIILRISIACRLLMMRLFFFCANYQNSVFLLRSKSFDEAHLLLILTFSSKISTTIVSVHTTGKYFPWVGDFSLETNLNEPNWFTCMNINIISIFFFSFSSFFSIIIIEVSQ